MDANDSQRPDSVSSSSHRTSTTGPFSAGWMWARALGRFSDEELERRLSDGGYPPPAAKVERPSYALRLQPPGEWLRDLGVDAADAPQAPAAGATGDISSRQAPPRGCRYRSSAACAFARESRISPRTCSIAQLSATSGSTC